MTPEEARRFLAHVDIGDEYRFKVKIGNNGEKETADYQGKVTTINEYNLWMRTNRMSPQVIYPQDILESELLDSPVKREFGSRQTLSDFAPNSF